MHLDVRALKRPWVKGREGSSAWVLTGTDGIKTGADGRQADRQVGMHPRISGHAYLELL